MTELFINGRFLTQPITGVQRFAREIIGALDKALTQQENAPTVTLLVPQGADTLDLKHIKTKVIGTRQGHAWEQWDLYRAARGGKLLSLCNSGPVLHGNQIVVIHDAMVYRTPQNFSFAYRTFHQTLGRVLAKRAQLGTVSNFSASELNKLLGIKTEDILVVYNGHEHIKEQKPDLSILAKLGVEGRPFFFFVGSPTPNKNLARAVKAFTRLKREDISFVIVGAAKANIFKDDTEKQPENIIRPGRLTDAEIVALYQNATALLFPSLYEGFGIPPLEAMVHGCPVLASTIPPVKEVCADAALYFDPNDIDDMAAKMRQTLDDTDLRDQLVNKGTTRYNNFSWHKSVEALIKRVGG